MANFFDFKVQGLDGTADILGGLRGKVTLAVNVASKCGYTPQYALLEELHQELKDGFLGRGFRAIDSARRSRAPRRRFRAFVP